MDTVVALPDEIKEGLPKMTNTDLERVINHVEKREGIRVPFNQEKISDAIFGALKSSSEDVMLARDLSEKVVQKLIEKEFPIPNVPTVEDIQDIVELVLLENNHNDIARKYIHYRLERRNFRESGNSKRRILTTGHKIRLQIFHKLAEINGKIVRSKKPSKEAYELEEMGYLSIDKHHGMYDLRLKI